MLHAIVMAGGSGTRFWPASRAARPKQLLPLSGGRSLLEETIRRVEGLVPRERVLVVTSDRLVPEVARLLADLPAASLVGEPCRRDTAPCIGLAALLCLARDPEAVLLVMPSDHVISPAAGFHEAIRAGCDLVAADPEALVTFGIRPTWPATGFGYVERADSIRIPGTGVAAFRVGQFREKPPLRVAEEYLAAGGFYWNAGIFVWRAATIVERLAEAEPDCVERLRRVAAAWERTDRDEIFAREFAAIRGISIDYAVLERSSRAVVIEAPFAWDDLGGWSAVSRQRGTDSEGNAIFGKHLGIDTTGSIVHSEGNHLVVTLGCADMLVVHVEDVTLVAPRSHEEAVRKVVAEIEKRGWNELL
jgi:mannose-1-phosphate guanylyltransferase